MIIVIIAIELIVVLKLLVKAIKIGMLLLRVTLVQIVHKVIQVFILFFLLLRNVN